jgi:ribosomal protein S18 acetylase RimI-like enzyme
MMVRRATPDDASTLASLLAASWQAAYRGIVPNAYMDGVDATRWCERLRDSLSQGLEEMDVAEIAGVTVGLVAFGPCRDPDVHHEITGEIRRIYVLPDYWRRGIGRALCRHAEEALRQAGYRTCVLWVLAGNVRGRRFYEALGYATDGATKAVELGASLQSVRLYRELPDMTCLPSF